MTLVASSTCNPNSALFRSSGLALAFVLALPAAPFTSAAENDPTEQLAELQALLLGYADTYVSAISDVSGEVRIRDPNNSEVRLIAHTLKLGASTSVYRIAIGPNPEVSLLDMVVFASLQRGVYETPRAREVYGDNRDLILSTLRALEKDVWKIAARYLNTGELVELRTLIDEWQAAHPEVYYVFLVRFADFGSERSKSKLVNKARKRGFLVDLSGTEQAVDEIRLLAERALYMSERMPLLIEWHIEKIFYELALAPEVRHVLKESIDITDTMDRFATSMEKFPGQIAAERNATITQISRRVAKERNATLVQLAEVLAAERRATVDDLQQALAGERMALFAELDTRQKMLMGTLSEVRAGLADAEKLTLGLGNTTAVVNEALQNADKLMARFDDDSSEPGEPFDINSYTEAIRELTIAIREANTLVLSMEHLTGKELPTKAIFDQILWTGTMLIVILCVAVFITMLIYRAVARHIVPRSSFE